MGHNTELEYDTFVQSRARRYALLSTTSIFLILMAVAIVNILVDPYLRFGTPRIAGLNDVKPAAIRQVRMAKAYGVNRSNFKTILFGNSRVDIGLNPRSDSIPSFFKPVYNLGQPGTGTQVSVQYLEHVLATHSPSNVVLAVDFMNYIRTPKQLNSSTSSVSLNIPTRLNSLGNRTSRNSLNYQRFLDFLASSLSLSAISDSVVTVVAQQNPNSASITDQGFNPGDAFRSLIETEGQSELFRQKNIEYVRKCASRIAPRISDSVELSSVVDFLQICKDFNIEVKLFIHPYHVDILEIFDNTGHWKNFEDWKRHLVDICECYGVELWDFSNCNSMTTETPPIKNDHETVMQWYWESGHFREPLGDKILGQLYSSSQDKSVGRKISSQNILEWMKKSRSALDKYQEEHKDRSDSIRDLSKRFVEIE